MSARGVPEAREFASALRSRIQALSHAHLYVKPGGQNTDEHDRTLKGLLDTVLAPYKETARPDAITITGCDASIDMRAATALALTLHELATNAVKYGALSTEKGQLALSCETSENVIKIVWRERGGPQISAAPTRSGFGSDLLIGSVVSQLGASLTKRWEPDGLTVEITIPVARLDPSAASQADAKR